MSISEEVEFYSGPFMLSGQFDLPHKEQVPIALIVPGAPQHDRYGNVRGYPGYTNYFEPFVRILLQSGYGVFRYDKGGTGKSSSGLSAPSDMVSAYRRMCKHPQLSKAVIIAFGAGSAHILRKWRELREIHPVSELIFLATSLNDLKLAQLDVPVCLITAEDNFLRSKAALERYGEDKNVRTMCFYVENASEQLCKEATSASLFKENGCTIDERVLQALEQWITYSA